MITHVHLDRPVLPVLHTGEVVVAGGSFGGVAFALHLARAGRQVILVEPRTYLGREMTATLRYWVRASSAEGAPEPLARCVDVAGVERPDGEIAFEPDGVKRTLEDLLLAEGVTLIYASQAVGVLIEQEAVSGLVIANKSGRQVLACSVILDATATSLVARLAGAAFEPSPADSLFGRVLEFTEVQPWEKRTLSVPSTLGLADDAVALHRGYRGGGHVRVAFRLALPTGSARAERGLVTSQKREIEARNRTLQLVSHLTLHEPAFSSARLAATSHELHGPHAPPLASLPPPWARAFDGARLPVGAAASASLSAFAGPASNLWCLNGSARLEPAQASRLQDVDAANEAGAALAQAVNGLWDRLVRPTAESRSPSPARASVPELEVREVESPQRGRRYALCQIGSTQVPVLRTTDVLVVGGGSSGAVAAITAAREGARTTLLDMNPDLGGTGTLGGVVSHWFGRRVGFAAQVSQWVADMEASPAYGGDTWEQTGENPYTLHMWNIEAKQSALLQQAEQAGVELFLNTIVLGTIMDGERVRGVVAATRFGPFAFMAEVTIDATGDGDVAAFAGAEFAYGAARELAIMWYSLAQMTSPGRTSNNFTSTVDVSNIEDYTRAILAGRRRGPACYDHGVYLAPRESRHILGEEVITLTDQLVRERRSDVVNIHFSNHDVKGRSDSDWVRLGLIPPNLESEIPYGALLPRGLDHILVTGKAISATHDALTSLRMQPDLENLGGVVGLAAALSARNNVSPREIDVSDLQLRLVAEGILPQEVLAREPEPQEEEADLEELIESFISDQRPLHAYSDMNMEEVYRERIPLVAVCRLGARVVPVLERALASAEGAQALRIAQALAMLGSQASVPILTSELERRLSAATLPVRDSRIRHAGLPPDQGAMPDEAYLLYALGMTRDVRSLPIWQRVVDLLDLSEQSLRDEFQGVFYYVSAVCFGAECLGDPAAIRMLEKMHAHPTLRDQVAREGFQVDFVRERQAMLELSIGRALARCSSPVGVRILIAYLDDNRALLAEQAHADLVAISGEDLGKDGQAWSRWLENRTLTVQPLNWRAEFERAGEEALT